MIADGDFADMNNATLAGGRFRRSTLVTALLASSALASIQSVPALAQTPPASSTSISIPAQPLSSALIAFSRQTRIEIFVPSSLAAGKRSAAVSDATSPEAALQRLLAGTGLAYRFTGARSVTVEARRAPGAAGAAPAGAIALDEVVVDGAGLPPPTGTIG
jgi:iron complex outermembrane receptor protein